MRGVDFSLPGEAYPFSGVSGLSACSEGGLLDDGSVRGASPESPSSNLAAIAEQLKALHRQHYLLERQICAFDCASQRPSGTPPSSPQEEEEAEDVELPTADALSDAPSLGVFVDPPADSLPHPRKLQELIAMQLEAWSQQQQQQPHLHPQQAFQANALDASSSSSLEGSAPLSRVSGLVFSQALLPEVPVTSRCQEEALRRAAIRACGQTPLSALLGSGGTASPEVQGLEISSPNALRPCKMQLANLENAADLGRAAAPAGAASLGGVGSLISSSGTALRQKRAGGPACPEAVNYLPEVRQQRLASLAKKQSLAAQEASSFASQEEAALPSRGAAGVEVSSRNLALSQNALTLSQALVEERELMATTRPSCQAAAVASGNSRCRLTKQNNNNPTCSVKTFAPSGLTPSATRLSWSPPAAAVSSESKRKEATIREPLPSRLAATLAEIDNLVSKYQSRLCEGDPAAARPSLTGSTGKNSNSGNGGDQSTPSQLPNSSRLPPSASDASTCAPPPSSSSVGGGEGAGDSLVLYKGPQELPACLYRRLYDPKGPVQFQASPLLGALHPRGELRLWPRVSDRIISQNSSKRKVHRACWLSPLAPDVAFPVAVKFVEDGNVRDGRSIKREIECHLYIHQRLKVLQQDLQRREGRTPALGDVWPSAEMFGYFLNRRDPGQSVLVTRKLSGPDFFDVIRAEHSAAFNATTSSAYAHHKLHWCCLALERVSQYALLGIRHNDIKPDNIVLDFYASPTSSERLLDVKLIDLGTACMQHAKDFTGGTSWYESPEQKILEFHTKKHRNPEVAKQVDIGLPSDAWGAGISITEVLMGRRVVDVLRAPHGPGPLEYRGAEEGWALDPEVWLAKARAALGMDLPQQRFPLCAAAARLVFGLLVKAKPEERATVEEALRQLRAFVREAAAEPSALHFNEAYAESPQRNFERLLQQARDVPSQGVQQRPNPPQPAGGPAVCGGGQESLEEKA